MVLGNLIKAGVAVGAAVITSDKVADAINGAVEKTTNRLAQASAARGGGTSSPTEPVNTTTKCIGCHAPMSGRVGDSYQCPYCDTEQTIS